MINKKIGVLLLVFIITIFSGCLDVDTQLKNIERTKDIPYHEGSLVAGGSAGTLFCKGIVTENAEGVESIKIIWSAVVTFPGDSVAGYLSWGNMWVDYPAGMFVMTPEGDVKWDFASGEHHIWIMVMTLYENSFRIAVIDNARIYMSKEYKGFGYLNMNEGTHEVSSAFASEPYPTEKPPYEMDIYIVTSPFKVVRQGNNFWFEG